MTLAPTRRSRRVVSRRLTMLLSAAVALPVAVVAVNIVSDSPVVAEPAARKVAQTAPLTDAAANAAATFQVQLGPEQRLIGPSGLIDSPYFSEVVAGELKGYLGNSVTYAYTSKGNAQLKNPKIVLGKGAKGSFDGCGAWLNGSTFKVTSSHLVAWYHAEAPGADDAGVCDYADASTVWRIAFVESFDGGKSWRKTSYPNNKVVTQDTSLTDPLTEDAGNARIIRHGSWLYMFYMASTRDDPTRQLNVARAPWNPAGNQWGQPGQWQKYFCTDPLLGAPVCDFSEPGIGGRSTALKNISPTARFVSWNSYLGSYIAPLATGRYGFSLRVSDGSNPMSWPSAANFYPPVSTAEDTRVDKWGDRPAGTRQLYAYPSLLGSTGSSTTTGQTFYLYYMKIFPGDDFTRRNLIRRKVTLVKTASTPYNRVQLTTYVDSKGRRRTSTEQPQSTTYRIQTSAGNLLTVARAGWNELYECNGSRGDAYLQQKACASGKPVRRVGWISPTKTAQATVPIYRCFDQGLRRHFASTSRKCGGERREFLLGYGLPALA